MNNVLLKKILNEIIETSQEDFKELADKSSYTFGFCDGMIENSRHILKFLEGASDE